MVRYDDAEQYEAALADAAEEQYRTGCQSEIEGHCPCTNPPQVHTFVEWLGPSRLCTHCYSEYHKHGYIVTPTVQGAIEHRLLKHMLHYVSDMIGPNLGRERDMECPLWQTYLYVI